MSREDLAVRLYEDWESVPCDQRLKCTAFILYSLVRFVDDGGGSFRHLIYDILGFGPDAYRPLYEAGGMALTNMLYDLLHPEDNGGAPCEEL